MPGGGWYCCCKGGCWEFLDNYDRADSTDVGGDWLEVAGQWEIKDNELICGPIGDALILGSNLVPVRSKGEMTARVKIVDPVDLDLYRVYVAVNRDAGDEYHADFFKTSTVGEWEVSLYHNETLLQTVTQTDPLVYEDRVAVFVCIDSDGNFRAGLTGAIEEYAYVTDESEPDGQQYGLGHDNSTSPIAAIFDDWDVSELRTGTELCDDCWCPCHLNVLDKELQGEFVNTSGRSTCMEGLTWDMDWQWNAGTPAWEGEIFVPDDQGGYPQTGYTFVWALHCTDVPEEGEESGENFSLTKQDSVCAVGGAGCATWNGQRPDASSTCEPLYLLFGPYCHRDSDLACNACHAPLSGDGDGEYWVAITEKAM